MFYAFHLLVCPGAFALDVQLVKDSSRWIGHIGRILNHDPVASVIPFFIGGGTSREEMVHPAELELRNLAHSAVAMSSVVIGGSVEMEIICTFQKCLSRRIDSWLCCPSNIA